MSNLLDKKIKRKKYFRIALGIIALIIFFYFRSGIWNGFSYAGSVLFRPVLVLGNGLGQKFSDLGSYFISKSSLVAENQTMRFQLNEEEGRMANYDLVVAENESLKEALGRKDAKTNMVLAVILSKPNKSPYDTIVVDAGEEQEIKTGDTVFTLGNVPIGRVAEVYPNSSKIILFSNSGENTQAIVKNKNTTTSLSGDVYMELVGRGGGNFEMILPRDFILEKGDQATMPGLNSYVLAIAETTISDPRNPFTKALLRSPANIQELKYVQIEK